MWRFLPGIIIVQVATVALVLVTVNTADAKYWLIFGLLALITSILAAFWFGSIANQLRKDDLARAKETFARERETLRVRAEKEKTKVIERSKKQVEKNTSRIHTKANLKVGASIAVAAGAGFIMLIAEFLTLGLLTLSTVGGGLAGYALRARQNIIGGKKENISATISSTPRMKTIEVKNPRNEPATLEKKSAWRE